MVVIFNNINKMQLSQEFSVPIGIMCSSLFDEITKYHKRIYSIIIRYKEGVICVGHSDGMKFKPDYYDPTIQLSVSQIVSGIVVSNEHIITSLFEKICVDHPKGHLKNYVIHYSGKTHCVTVCKNRIGSCGMHRCSLYEPFVV